MEIETRPGGFEAEFRRRVDDIFKRGEAVGLTVTAICKGTKTARATPDRWRKKAPLSITLVDRMEKFVAEEEARQRKAK